MNKSWFLYNNKQGFFMKSFTKNILSTSLLFASMSALAANLITSPGPSIGPAGNDFQSTEILSWMSFANSDINFRNATTGGKDISITIAFLRRDDASGIYVPTTRSTLVKPGQERALTLKGDDALVKVFAGTVESGIKTPILNLNLCAFNNQYYTVTISPGYNGISRKDITFIGGSTTPEMISYPTKKLKADGFYNLNLGDFECWVDQFPPKPPVTGSEPPEQPQTQPGLEDTLS